MYSDSSMSRAAAREAIIGPVSSPERTRSALTAFERMPSAP